MFLGEERPPPIDKGADPLLCAIEQDEVHPPAMLTKPIAPS